MELLSNYDIIFTLVGANPGPRMFTAVDSTLLISIHMVPGSAYIVQSMPWDIEVVGMELVMMEVGLARCLNTSDYKNGDSDDCMPDARS